MTALVENAAAKINLTLRVLGRRDDGYHALESVVAFADLADRVTLTPARANGIVVAGPFADEIVGENLVTRMLASVTAKHPALRSGRFTIEKVVPVAAGLGGGSADAAAALRLIDRANPGALSQAEKFELALEAGSDVPVCLLGRTSLMGGRGEDIRPLPRLPRLAAVLVNARAPVPMTKTRDVFQALGAAHIRTELSASGLEASVRNVRTPAEFIALLSQWRNDLEPAASRIMPQIGEVMATLRALPDVALVRLSGAGPTCFALFPNSARAAIAANELSRLRPAWWVRPVELGEAISNGATPGTGT